MKKRVIVLGIAVGLVCIAAMDRAMALWRHDVPIGVPLDLSAISKLRVDGAASLISVTTDPGTPLTATLTGERDGWGSLWQSGWHARDCSDSGRMHIDNDTLVVDVADMSRYFDWSDCTIKLKANLRPQSAVLIRQKAARIGLDGDFPPSMCGPMLGISPWTAMPARWMFQALRCGCRRSSRPSARMKPSFCPAG